jgi:hypothetical protein
VTDLARVIHASTQLADAIGRRDLAVIRTMLAPGFVLRSHGGNAADADAFIAGIAAIPGEIVSVQLENVQVDLTPGGALVTGVQRAQVRVDGEVVSDRRRFVDWFVRVSGEWRIQAAVDLPEQIPAPRVSTAAPDRPA